MELPSRPYLYEDYAGLEDQAGPKLSKILLLACSALAVGGFYSVAAADTDDSEQAKAQPTGLTKDSSTDEIFEAMFGRKRAAEIALRYPVRIDGVNQVDIEIKPSATPENIEIDRAALVDLILPMLTGEKQSELLRTLGSRPKVTVSELQALGYTASFDASELALDFTIPVSFRHVVPIPLQRREGVSAGGQYVEQAGTSAIFNLTAGSSYVHQSLTGLTGFQGTQADLDIALNRRNVVLETGVRYLDSGDSSVTLADTTLTFDLVEPMLRFEAGDLTVTTSGLQGNPDIAGIAGFRNFNLKPYEDYRTNPSQRFELERPARVSIYINGQFIREIRLAPGRYNLTDLPLRTSAGNDVILDIVYDSGETQRVVFAAFYDFDLLKAGLSEFSANLGITSERVRGVREYDTGNPAFSGFYRRGLSDLLTVGVNAQADTSLVNVGAEALYATGIGSFGLLSSYSDHDLGQGAAITGLYRWSGTNIARQSLVNAQARYQEEGFQTLGGNTGGSRFKYDVAMRASTNVTKLTRVQYSGGFRRRYTSSEDEYSHSFLVNRRLGRGTLSASVRYEDYDDEPEWSFGIGYTMRFGDVGAQFAHDTRDRATRASIDYRPDQGIDSWAYDLAYTRQSSLDDVRAGVSYIGNRFDARFEQQLATGLPGGSLGDEHFSNIFLGSAFVFADGHTAFSRPVFDSFAIFDTREGADAFELAVDPYNSAFGSAGSYAARSSRFGPAVLTDLQSYYDRAVQVDAPDAPAGTSVGGDVFNFKPGFRSGYIVKVGSDRNVSVIGRLVDEKGAPVKFAVGHAITPDGERRPTFSNGGGRFYVDGLKGGETLRIEFESPAGMVADVTVPKGSVGVARLDGDVVLRRAMAAEPAKIASLPAAQPPGRPDSFGTMLGGLD